MTNKGFTLVETLVMIGIVGIVGVILTTTLVQIFQGQSKASLISQIKQNGQVVMDEIDRQIRLSEKIICLSKRNTVSSDPNDPNNSVINDPNAYDTIVFQKKGVFTRIIFFPKNSAENGYIGEDHPTSNYKLDACNATLGDSSGVVTKLTNSDPVNGISIIQGKFSKIAPSAGVKDIIGIEFALTPGEKAKLLPENANLNVKFKTTVELR